MKIDFSNLSRQRMLLAALIVSALLLVVPPAVSGRVRLAVAEIFEPIASAARNLGGGVRRHLAAFGRGSRLQRKLQDEREESDRLRRQLAEARDEISRRERAEREMLSLHHALERAGWRSGVPVAANVVRREGRWENLELLVDRGTDQGAGRGAAVMVGEALVGMVGEAWPSGSRVLLIGHPELPVVPARIAETGQQGFLRHAGGRLELSHITRDQVVRPGYQVVTSGLDGKLPPGCLLGTVAAGVAAAEDQPFYKIFVDSPRPATSPDVVWIVVGTEAGAPPPKEAPAAGAKEKADR